MDAAIIVALIALVGALANVAITYYLNTRSEARRQQREADAKLTRYRRALVFSATELSDRLDNILERGFLETYVMNDSPQRDEAILTTLYRISQYFGWTEIMRRYLRTPDAASTAEVTRLNELQGAIGRTFATDSYGDGDGFMIWRETQRAIGELMIREEAGVVDTIGVADFLTDFEKFRPWLYRVEHALRRGIPVSGWPEQGRRLKDLERSLDDLAGGLGDGTRVTAPSRTPHRSRVHEAARG